MPNNKMTTENCLFYCLKTSYTRIVHIDVPLNYLIKQITLQDNHSFQQNSLSQTFETIKCLSVVPHQKILLENS